MGLGGVVGPCDFGVSPSPFALDFGTLDFGTSDSGLTMSTLSQTDRRTDRHRQSDTLSS